MNLPSVSVRDIHHRPQIDEGIVIATHGRDAWVLDDASAVQAASR